VPAPFHRGSTRHSCRPRYAPPLWYCTVLTPPLCGSIHWVWRLGVYGSARAYRDYRMLPSSFPNPVAELECDTAVETTAGGLTTEWWAVVTRSASFDWGSTVTSLPPLPQREHTTVVPPKVRPPLWYYKVLFPTTLRYYKPGVATSLRHSTCRPTPPQREHKSRDKGALCA